MALLWMLAVTASATVTPIVVMSGPYDETGPSASDGYFAWSQNSLKKPNHYNAYIQPDGGSKRRLNDYYAIGYAGGLDGDQIVYQEVALPSYSSNLRLFDAPSTIKFAPPPGVNTRWWEWYPTMSPEWLLFGRNNIYMVKHPKQWLLLTNFNTGEQRVLLTASTGNHIRAYPGQVAGNYVTYTDCRGGCQAFRYDIAADQATKLPNPGGQQYGIAVTPDGTVYVLRDVDNDCSGADIVRVPLGGPSTIIATIPSGRDGGFAFARVNADTSTDLFFEDYKCSKGFPTDIYEVPGADSVLAPVFAPSTPVEGSDFEKRTTPVGARSPAV